MNNYFSVPLEDTNEHSNKIMFYKKVSSVFIKVLCAAAMICSTAYLVMLGWYSYLAADDFSFIGHVDNDGILGFVQYAYAHIQSRFSSFYMMGWIFKIWGHASNLIGYAITLLLLGYATIYYALRQFTGIKDRLFLFAAAVLILNISVMAYIEIGTFFWVCCAIYTVSVYATILLFVTIFFSRSKLWLRWVIVCLLSVFLSGGAENYTPVLIALMGSFMLYQMITTQTWKFWRTTEQQMMLVSMLILIVGFLIVAAGPARKVRVASGWTTDFAENFALVPYLMRFAKASVVLFLRLLSRSLYYVLFIPLGWLIGIKMRNNGYVMRIKTGKAIMLSLLAALFAIEISVAAAVYGTGWYAPDRANSFMSFILMALVVYWSVLLGLRTGTQRHVYAYVALANLIIASMSCCFIKKEQPLVANVHAQVDNCYAQIEEHKKSGSLEPLVLEPIVYPYLPNSYAIMRTAINRLMGKHEAYRSLSSKYFPYKYLSFSRDPNDFRNRGICAWANVDFEVIGWE